MYPAFFYFGQSLQNGVNAMAETIRFSIEASTDFKQLDGLINKLETLQTTLGNLNEHLKIGSDFAREINQAVAATNKLVDANKRMAQSAQQANRASSQSLNSLTMTLKKAAAQNTALTRTMTNQQSVAKRLTAIENQRAAAEKNLADAQKKYQALISKGGGSAKEISEAKQLLDLAAKRAASVKRNADGMRQELLVLKNSEVMYRRLGKEIADLAKDGKEAPQALTRAYTALGLHIKEVTQQMVRAGDVETRLSKVSQSGLIGRIQQSQHLKALLTDEVKTAQNAARAKEAARKQEEAGDKAYIQLMNNLARDNARIAAQQVREAQQVARAEQQAFRQRMQGMTEFRNSLSNLSRFLGTMMGSINRFISTISSGLSRALTTASRAVGSLTNSAGSAFARLRSNLDATGRSFLSFGNIVGRSMNQGTSAMQKFYSAGFSLLASGAILNRLGDRIFGQMGNIISGYTEYERILNRLAISAAVPKGGEAQYGSPEGVNPNVLQDLVFGLQRGEYGTPVLFDAKDVAQALYYYTSAIGQPVGRTNMGDVAKAASEILTIAQVTMTDVQTMTKGTLNIAQEFGIDPRATDKAGNLINSGVIANIADQLGYLANISSMEVPDIVETFKMLGPMAHILSDRNQPGAGLEETFGLAFFASEMGLRGGNVGRGVNQLLTTLLDPTDKAIATAADAWGADFGEATKENWNKFFFDTSGGLQGGITGLFQKIGRLPENQAAGILATLFTTNATRSAVAIEQALRQHGGFDEIVKKLQSTAPADWAQIAREAYLNTLFGAFDNLKNAWFQVQTAMVDGIRGPLVSALHIAADVLFQVANFLNQNPFVTKFIGAIALAAGAVATFAGALLVVMGTMLLLARGFAMIGAAAHPFFILMSALPRVLLLLSPILLLLAGVIIALYTAWTHNFMGMTDAVHRFIDSFDFEKSVTPKILALISWLQRLGRAFVELINGILLGFGRTNNLGALLTSIFGPLLGPALYGQLLRFSHSLEGFRRGFIEFVQSIVSGSRSLSNVGRAIQGFLEAFFLGTMSLRNISGTYSFGKALGIDTLPDQLLSAGNALRGFVMMGVAYFGMLKAAIFDAGKTTLNLSPFGNITVDNSIAGKIRANMEQIIDAISGDRIRSVLSSLFVGIAEGFAAAIIGAAKALELLTRALANTGRAGDWIDGYTKKWFGFQTTIEGVAKTIGVVIGTWLGARLIMALTPGIVLMLRFATIVGQVGISIAGAAIQFAFFIARMLVATAAIGAHILATTGLIAVRVALFAIETAYSAIQALRIVQTAAQTGATIAQTVANAGLTGSFVGLLAAMGPVAIVAVVIVAAFVGLIAVGTILFLLIGSITAVFLIHTAITQGLRAAWEGLVSVYNGFVAVVTPVIGVLLLVGQGIQWVFEKIQALLGISNGFYLAGAAMGLALGLVALGVVGLIAVLGVVLLILAAFAASMIMVAAVMVLPLAPLALFLAALQHLGVLDEVANGVVDVFKWMFDTVTSILSALGHFFEAIFALMTGDFKGFAVAILSAAKDIVDALNQLFDAMNALSGLASRVGIDIPEIHISTSPLDTALRWLTTKGETTLRTTAEAQNETLDRVMENARQQANASVETHTSIMGKILSRLGLNTIFEDLGVDINHLTVDDLKSLMSLDSLEQLQKEYSAGNLDFLPGMKEYMDDVNEYQAWQRLVAKIGENNARDIYDSMGLEIPQPPSFEDYIAGYMGGAEALNDAISEETAKFEQFKTDYVSALEGLDLPTLLNAAFAAGPEALGTMNVAGWLGANAEKIVGNIGDAAPWVNQIELLMDAAISGGLSQGVEGVNIHEVLKQPLAHISEQTGVSVEEMLKDVPKFIADDSATPYVVDAMMKTIGGLPEEVRKRFDILGKDIGQGIEGAGLDWQEVVQYAISKGMAGEHWNLIDYFKDAWGMTTVEAAEYAKTHGVDPGILSDSLIPPDVADYMKNGAGQYSVIAADAYEFLMENIVDESGKVAEVTQEEWDNLSDINKAAFTKMGYTFVIEGTNTADNIRDGYQAMIEAQRQAIAEYDQSGVIDPEHARFDFLEDLGNGWVRVKDLFSGTEVEIPAVLWSQYADSVREWKAWNEKTLPGIIDSIYAAFGGSDGRFKDVGRAYAAQDYADIAAQGGAPAAPPMIDPPKIDQDKAAEEATKTGEGMATKTGESFASKQGEIQTSIQTTIQGATDAAAGTIDMASFATQMATNLQTSLSTEFATAIQTAIHTAIGSISMESGGGGYAGVGAGSPAGVASGPFDSIFKGYATTASEAFKTELSAKLPATVTVASLTGTGGEGTAVSGGPFDSIFQGYARTSAQAFKDELEAKMPATVTADLLDATSPFDSVFTGWGATAASAFKSSVSTSLAGWSPTIPSVAQGNNTEVTGGTPNDMYGSQVPQAPTTTTTMSITVALVGYDAALRQLNTLRATAALFAVPYNSTIGNNNQANALVELHNLRTAATNFAVEWVSWVGNNNASAALTELHNLRTAAFNFAKTWNSWVGNNNASSAQTELDNLISSAQVFAVTWTATVEISGYDNVYNSLQSLIDKAGDLDTMWVTPSVSLNDYATATLDGIINRLNGIDNRTVTSTVNNVTNNITNNTTNTNNTSSGSGPQPAARGGIIHELYQIVGEKGAELAQLPIGTRVFTAQDTRKMFTKVADALREADQPLQLATSSVASAQRSRPFVSITASPEYAGARQMEVRPSSSQGDVHIEINNLTIAKEVDIDKALERVDRLIGRKMELARRGMIPFEEARTM